MIVELHKQVQDLTAANSSIESDCQKARTETQKANTERAEAANALIKLDEVRVVMNRLMGPQGPLSMSERHKFLINNTADASIDNTMNDRSGDFYTNGMSQPHIHAQEANSGSAKQGRSSREAVNKGAANIDHSKNDDDAFWYQASKDNAYQ